MNKDLIIDVDTGTDDAMALILAMRTMKDRILAVTVTHGNLPLVNTLENTLRVVEFMGGGIPVYAGMPVPMVQDLAPGRTANQIGQGYRQVIDGEEVCVHEDYLPLPEATIRPEKEHAVSFLVRTLREAEEPLTIVSVGPASNIGMALRMDPTIAGKIGKLIIMGGGMEAVNITSCAEYNFYKDPEAAAVELAADCEKVIFPLDATTSVLFGDEDAARIKALGRPWTDFYAQLMIDFLKRIKLLNIAMTDDPEYFGIAMHDVYCVLYLLDSSFVTDIKVRDASVDFGGSLCDGRLCVENRVYIPKSGKTKIAYRLDKDKILELLEKYLA
ncbi:MAG: nucleoside hydrolase [Oscillospiraceae bacterium]|jgi:inosine-uridine nucleoside N-ribohydrolase